MHFGPLTRVDLMAEIERHDVIVVRLGHQIDAELLEKARSLRAIVTPTTGLDHVDLETAERLGVEVLSLRTESDVLGDIASTAEHTWALLLALMRRIPWAHSHVIEGGWDRDGFRGNDLAGLRLGILGLGRLGSVVASYGRAFGMKVHAFDPYRASWPDDIEASGSLEELATYSDVLSIHVHLTENTEGMIDDSVLSGMPERAVLVNTSRGEIVNESDLLAALASGHLRGAALDVLAGERSESPSPLVEFARHHDNLLITPHIGGATQRSMIATEVHMAELLQQRFAGGLD